MKTDPSKIIDKHPNTNHLEDAKVSSHTQRDDGAWVRHTLMLEGYDVPFRFMRQGKYQSLKGARVNLTYYPQTENVAGMTFEYMKVIRVKRA